MKRLTCATGLLSLALTMSAQAVIIGGGVTGGTAESAGGTFQEITLPFVPPAGNANEVGNNTFQTPDLYAFNEGQNIMLPSALTVDALAGGGSGSLAAGTVIPAIACSSIPVRPSRRRVTWTSMRPFSRSSPARVVWPPATFCSTTTSST